MRRLARRVQQQLKLITLGMLTSILVISGVISSAAPAFGFIPNLDDLGNFQALTSKVEFTREGSLDFAPIYLDGYFLFDVAAVVPLYDNKPTNLLPIESRVRRIQTRIRTYVRGGFDSRSLTLKVTILNDETVVVVEDKTNPDGIVLITVTAPDTLLAGVSANEVGQNWAEILEMALLRAQRERQSDYLIQKLLISAGTLLAVLVFNVSVVSLQHWLDIHRQHLQLLMDNLNTVSVEVTESIEIHEAQTPTSDASTNPSLTDAQSPEQKSD